MQNPTYPSTDTVSERKASTDVRSTIERVEDAVPKIKERFHAIVEAGEERVNGIRHAVQDNVQQKPVQSFLVAAGIGAVIGLIVGRSRR